jgi:ABC-type phosphate transport system substrate-binding protein
MRLTSKLMAACGALALAMAAVSAGPALADPPAGIVPRASDVVGAGSDTIQYVLDQLSADYSKAHPKAAALLYSWDATDPVTGKTGEPIETKTGCKPISRPDGSSAGITALEANTTDQSDPKDFCIDYAGSSRGPAPNDPACGPGGLCFVPFAGDAVTWATRDAASGGTDAPASLTRAQLRAIYECKIRNWAKVGGASAPIKPFLPDTSSGTRTFWLTALGGGTTPVSPGHCVSDGQNSLQDNEGISRVLDSPEVIVPYSVADYIAQVYHDAPCANASCTGSPACTPAAGQNAFGCDQHGVLGIHEIGGSEPVLPWPPPSPPCPACAINPKFSPMFQRFVYAVVRGAATHDDIPAYLEPFFSAKTAKPAGFVCTARTALADLTAYGFLPVSASRGGPGEILASSRCGVSHWRYSPRRGPGR